MKFSKKIVAKLLGVFRNKTINKYSFDTNNGSSQLWVLFGDDMVKALNVISISKKDKEWANKNEGVIYWAIKYRNDVIDTIISYGMKEMCDIILQNFDLYSTMRDMAKKGENFENYD